MDVGQRAWRARELRRREPRRGRPAVRVDDDEGARRLEHAPDDGTPAWKAEFTPFDPRAQTVFEINLPGKPSARWGTATTSARRHPRSPTTRSAAAASRAAPATRNDGFACTTTRIRAQAGDHVKVKGYWLSDYRDIVIRRSAGTRTPVAGEEQYLSKRQEAADKREAAWRERVPRVDALRERARRRRARRGRRARHRAAARRRRARRAHVAAAPAPRARARRRGRRGRARCRGCERFGPCASGVPRLRRRSPRSARGICTRAATLRLRWQPARARARAAPARCGPRGRSRDPTPSEHRGRLAH